MRVAIQFGAGNISRGFIGMLLAQAGYHVTYGDVVDELIDRINQAGTYTVHIMDVKREDIAVTNISAINSSAPAMVDAIADKRTEIITTAVGVTVLPRLAPIIAQGIVKRKALGSTATLNIVACENAICASSQLKEHVYKLLTKAEQTYCGHYVGFPNCSVYRIVPPLRSENSIDVAVERYYEWNVEKASFKGELPQIGDMNFVDDLVAYTERKLFTLNTGHAITAYLGAMMQVPTIDVAITNETIYAIVHAAMIESGDGLIRKYGLDAKTHRNYINETIQRFKNPHVKDDVLRVGREPLHKLSAHDRLTKPLMTADGYGLSVDHLILGIASALHYDNPADAQSIELQQKLQDNSLFDAITDITGISHADLVEHIVAAYGDIECIV